MSYQYFLNPESGTAICLKEPATVILFKQGPADHNNSDLMIQCYQDDILTGQVEQTMALHQCTAEQFHAFCGGIFTLLKELTNDGSI